MPTLQRTCRAPSSSSVCQSEDLWVIGWTDGPRQESPREGASLSLYLPDFFLKDPRPWVNVRSSLEVSRSELISSLETYLVQLKSSSGVFAFSGPAVESSVVERGGGERCSPLSEQGASLSPFTLRSSSSYSSFKRVFHDLQEQISKGILQKAVPVIFLNSEGGLSSEELALQRALLLIQLLKNSQGSPLYVYGWWDFSGEGILGATPELLFSQPHGNELQTMALAGTRLKEPVERSALSALEGSLLEDPKERLEHQIVVDSICTSLTPWGRVQVGQTQELHLKTLSHLYTPIELHLQGTQGIERSRFSDWVRALHPTPALGASPREPGWDWLKAQAVNTDRARFGAPFGVYFSEQHSYCLVAIRNIQWIQGAVTMGAGCGVVRSSQVDREWRELQGKLRAIHRLFGLDDSHEVKIR